MTQELAQSSIRTLYISGLESDGSHIVLVDMISGDKFRVPIDEKLYAATRGDVARLGQIELALETNMRPREIQSRIRAGASITEIAEEAGLPPSKVERFAYPVLLERSQKVEQAQHAHPIAPSGPMEEILDHVVRKTFRNRGLTYEEAQWDAFKDENAHWIVQFQWNVGRTHNTAHFQFQPDHHGGLVTPLDQLAEDLLNPDTAPSLAGLELQTEVKQPLSVNAAALQKSSHPPTLSDLPKASDLPNNPDLQQPVDLQSTSSRSSEESGNQSSKKSRPRRDKRGKPILPSWDDVLFGVRGNDS